MQYKLSVVKTTEHRWYTKWVWGNGGMILTGYSGNGYEVMVEWYWQDTVEMAMK